MKKITTLTVFLFFTVLAFGQDFKYVNTETLNIRESAGKQYNVVGQVNKGDKVTAISERNGWTEIETDNGTKGFVATKYLTSDSQSDHNNRTSTGYSPIIILGIVFLILYIIYIRYKKKCKRCGKWYAMEITDEEVVDRVSAAVKKTTKVRNSKGETIRTNEVYIPATKTKYLVTETCKFCGYEEQYYKSETKEN